MTIRTIDPAKAQQAIEQGALLVDIRDPDEYARASIPGALNVPLSQIDQLPDCHNGVIFHCRSGMRTQANAQALIAAAAGVPCYILTGGIEKWRSEGLPVDQDRSQPLELMRQVQLTAGGMALAGALLSHFVATPFLWLSAFVGAGLMLAGATGWCGLAKLLLVMPWNRRSQAA